MIRVALVEDDPLYTKELVTYLKQYEKESGEKIKVTSFSDGDEIAINYQADYDIILMDIEMQFMDGMTAAEQIRKADSEVVIIFITNMPQYAIRGYAVDALDYVLKPLSYYAFSQRIDRALSRMKKRTNKYLTIRMKGANYKLKESDITYVEVDTHDLIFHTKEKDYTTGGSMRSVEEKVDPSKFFRCNKCYLVNLEHVDGIEQEDALVGNTRIQVSRARKKAFMDALNDYMNEVGK